MPTWAHVHFHLLCLDGVYVADGDTLRFEPAPAPTRAELESIVQRVYAHGSMANDPSVITATSKSRPPPKTTGGQKDTAPPPSPRTFSGFSEITSFLSSIADLLRGDYKQADYGKVILPLTVLRRLDCVLDKSKAKVLAKHAELKQAKHPEGTIEKMLLRASGTTFYNTSKLDFERLKATSPSRPPVYRAMA